jgi:hypothetical protein
MAAVSIKNSTLFTDANLKGLWRFDSDATDDKNGHTLTLVNTPSYATGQFANGLQLQSASSQFAYFANNVDHQMTSDFSIHLWVNFASVTNDEHAFFGKYRTDNSQRGYLLEMGTNTSVNFWCASSGTGAEVVSFSWTPSTTTWYELWVVYTASAGSGKFYVNGTQTGGTQTGLPAAVFNSSEQLNIGCYNGSGTPTKFIDGILDDVALFNRVITPTEITAHWNGTDVIISGGSPSFITQFV